MSHKDTTGDVQKVVVIGAGVAGLCTLRHFTKDHKYQVVAYEQSNVVGGIWNYPDGCEEHTDVPPSSPYYCRTYRDLVINSPADLTHFPEFPLPPGTPNFVGREVIWNYLIDYAKKFDLFEHIKFRHQVTRVSPIFANRDPNFPAWQVDVVNLETQDLEHITADILIICNGHNGKPYLPMLNNIEKFKGSVIHSCAFRVPDMYQDKRVLIVGAMVSANDICRILLPFARRIIFSRRVHRTPVYHEKYPHVLETGTVADFTERSVILQDGSEEPLDAIILCTGFDYHFPFLTAECQTTVDRGRVGPIYRHLIHCELQSMAFIGLLNVLPLLAAGVEHQIQYYKSFLDGKIKLPSVKEMMADTENDYQARLARGFQPHEAHKMIEMIWPYIEQLSKEGGFPSYQPHWPEMFKDYFEASLKIPYNYREFIDKKITADKLEKQRKSIEQCIIGDEP